MSYLRIIDRLLSWVTDWLPPQSPTNKQTNKGTNKQTDKEKNKQTKERPTGCLHIHPTIFPTEALGWVPKRETMQNNQTNKQTKRQTNKRTNKNKPSSPHSVQYLLLYQRNVCFISSKKNTWPSGGQFGPHILLWLQTLSLQLSCCVSLKDFACKLDVLYPGAVSLYRGKEIHCWLGKLFLICKYWGKIAGGRLAGPLLVHIWPVWDLLGLSWLKWKCESSSEKHREGCLHKLGKVRKVDLVNVVAAVACWDESREGQCERPQDKQICRGIQHQRAGSNWELVMRATLQIPKRGIGEGPQKGNRKEGDRRLVLMQIRV